MTTGVNRITMRNSILEPQAIRLFLISFLILFFELVCIRWLSSYILYLGYFTNFVLLGALLGIGAGVLLAYRKRRYIKWLPPLLFAFLVVILFTRAQVSPFYEQFVYFTSTAAALSLPTYVLLPLIFVGVTVIFTFLSQDLGVLLTKYAPLKAYSINILGSLAGIACFTLVSLLSFPSWLWFLIAALLMIPFLPRDRTFGYNIAFLFGVVCVIGASDYAFKNIWSPYYRLNLFEATGEQVRRVDFGTKNYQEEHYILQANGAGHQGFTSLELNEHFYELPYTIFQAAPVYENALVIGAGGGNDIAVALEHNVEYVDAVEIDPAIVELGKVFHPEDPYADPRVTVYVDDARAFLEKSDKQYDLVIYALPDSLVLATNFSSVRLESYLFTIEAFQSVKEHLKPDGLFVLYNYYRFDWLVDKIAGMLAQVYGDTPVYYRSQDPQLEASAFVTIFAGPKVQELDLAQPGLAKPSSAEYAPATDNWPFLYMQQPSLPSFYTLALGLVLLFSFIYVNRLAPKGAINRYGMPFFFMGAAFTLLETKSIVQFLLLFGSTWLVNSLVFFAILLVVLIANWLASRFKFSRMWILYTLLFVSLLINFIVPLRLVLFENLVARYVIATILLFSPIFFANLIYSTIFRDTEQTNVAYGSNLLGTMLGGATEYLALYFGYQQLAVFAGLFYFAAFFMLYLRQRELAVAASD